MEKQKKKSCDVLITYCWNRVGYNILRSLTSHGLSVYVADVSKHNICSMSKFCAGSFSYPDPFKQEEEFITCLLEHVAQLNPKVLLPTHDESIIIAKHIHRFPHDLIIPIANYNTLIHLSNKIIATRYAQEAGIPIPKVYHNLEEIDTYPIVFKTAIGNSAKGVFFPHNRDEINNLKLKFQNVETFIQQKISGTDYSVDCIRMNGFFKASAYRALVTKTDGGGTTTQRIIVDMPILISYAKKLLDYADYYGVCGLDFKFDEKTNSAAFIEVNARYTGGLATPIAAGFDIPYIHYCLATKGTYNHPIDIKIGTKTKWILGDIITLVGRLISLKLTSQELRQVFKFKGFDCFDDFRSDDKKAFWGEMRYYLNKLLKNRKLNP